MCVHLCAFVHVSTYVCGTYVFMTCMYVCVLVCTCVYMRTYSTVHLCVYIHICTCVLPHTYVPVLTRMDS